MQYFFIGTAEKVRGRKWSGKLSKIAPASLTPKIPTKLGNIPTLLGSKIINQAKQ